MKIKAGYISQRPVIIVSHQDREELVFPAGSYRGIGTEKMDRRKDDILSSINNFFYTLSKDDLESFYNFYCLVPLAIRGSTIDNVKVRISLLLDQFSKMSLRIEIDKKLKDFCLNDPLITESYPNLELSKQYHDIRPELTFNNDEYASLTALCMFTKLMLPLWGVIHRECTALNFSTEDYRKLMLKHLHEFITNSEFGLSMYAKLQASLSNFTINKKRKYERRYGPVEDRDIGSDRLEDILSSMVLIDYLVSYDPITQPRDKEPSNALKFISNVMDRSIFQILKSAQNKAIARSRKITVMT